MQIGEVIRTYRKQKNMTQEEMANYLGVTAPAVNKWENGNSMPDITLLAPIARLLGITLADSLFTFFMRKEQYEEAEKYLSCFSEQSPERKRKQAFIFSKTGKTKEAYKAYEELLFSEYQMLSMVFNGIYGLAIEDNNLPKAHEIVNKQQELAKLFDMGEYHESLGRLELAAVEKNADVAIETMEKMIESVEDITEFNKSSLYEHMAFKETSPEFVEEIKKKLLECFCDEEKFGFLKEDKRWQELVKGKK